MLRIENTCTYFYGILILHSKDYNVALKSNISDTFKSTRINYINIDLMDDPFIYF